MGLLHMLGRVMTPHDDRVFSLLAQAPPPRSLGVALAQCFTASDISHAKYKILWRLFNGSSHHDRQVCAETLAAFQAAKTR